MYSSDLKAKTDYVEGMLIVWARKRDEECLSKLRGAQSSDPKQKSSKN